MKTVKRVISVTKKGGKKAAKRALKLSLIIKSEVKKAVKLLVPATKKEVRLLTKRILALERKLSKKTGK
ncbi:MAG: hypothetical protein ABIG95_00825 [Candidatus Woesearchaeota archaeon]